jgi:molybdate transport system substrate-binding protein
MRTHLLRRISIALTLVLLLASAAHAEDIKILTSGGFAAALHDLAPALEQAVRATIVLSDGATLPNGPDSIPAKLQRGEAVDVVIMSASGLDDQIKAGTIIAGSRVDLGRSGIGMAVKAGTPKPDISSVDALKRTLLAAKSIAYSSSISGVYLSTELFPRLGIADQVAGKSQRIDRERVGSVVARGEAEIGFQQTSELVPVPGIVYVGPLPPEVQRVTIFAAGIAVTTRNRDQARAVIAFLASAAARDTIVKSGLEPVQPK